MAESAESTFEPAGTDSSGAPEGRRVSEGVALYGAWKQLAARGLHPDVPEQVQARSLAAIEDSVRTLVSQGKIPLVLFDLDETTLLGRERVSVCLRRLASTVPEFAEPERLSCLPGYTDEGIRGFVETVRSEDGMLLKEKYASLDLAALVHGAVRQPYWSAAPWTTDELSPGFLEFYQQLQSLGGQPVFISNRPGGYEASLQTLVDRGVNTPVLIHPDVVPPGDVALPAEVQTLPGDARAKARLLLHLFQRFGADSRVAACVDDRLTNRVGIIATAEALEPEHVGRIVSVAVAPPGRSTDVVTREQQLRISSFLRSHPVV